MMTVGTQSITRPFVVASAASANLLGRDLLIKLGASIKCGPDSLVVQLPDGTAMNCGLATTSHSQCVMQPVHPEHAGIYRGLIEPETPGGAGVLSAYLRWKPWISALEPYAPTTDPLHITLLYDRKGDEVYQEHFQEQLVGVVLSDTALPNPPRLCR